MTYCLGLSLEQGLVFASDSRTNAGVDYVTTYSKMHLFQPAPDRLFVILSAGNLATTQEVVNHLQRDIDYPVDGPNLLNARYMFEAAEYVGRISQQVQIEHNPALSASGVSGETTLLLGGQIAGHPPQLIMIYPQGNYITASAETPYLQIGESKYGKPALDRIVHRQLALEEGARLCLVSLDGTTRSNITVGPPFELAIYLADTFTLQNRCSFAENDPYLIQLREGWNNGIRAAFAQLPPLTLQPLGGAAPAAEPAATNPQSLQSTTFAQQGELNPQPVQQPQQLMGQMG